MTCFKKFKKIEEAIPEPVQDGQLGSNNSAGQKSNSSQLSDNDLNEKYLRYFY